VAGASGAPERGIELIEFDPLVSGDPLLAQERSTVGVHPALMDRVVGLYGAVIVRAPWAWGLAFHLAALPGMRSIYHALHGRTVTSRIRAAIRATRAQAVVSVHPLVNDAMVAARNSEGRDLPLLTVVTDLVDVHPWWANGAVDRYVVGTGDAAGALIGLGIEPSRISVTGIPLRPTFGRVTSSAREMREHLGLDPAHPTVLFMGGGDGAGRLAEVVGACDAVVRSRGKEVTRFVVICGRNEPLRAAFEAREWRGPTTILGQVANVHEWMTASDVVVTKPGSLTVSESLAIGRPLLLGPPLPGQEEGNIPFVCDNGAGMAYRDATEASMLLEGMLADPASLWEMGQRTFPLRHLKATERVLDLVQSLVMKSRKPQS
jgi:UDP-N-acetylglucosamine:LPS N-acetylglucosamine transferase